MGRFFAPSINTHAQDWQQIVPFTFNLLYMLFSISAFGSNILIFLYFNIAWLFDILLKLKLEWNGYGYRVIIYLRTYAYGSTSERDVNMVVVVYGLRLRVSYLENEGQRTD